MLLYHGGSLKAMVVAVATTTMCVLRSAGGFTVMSGNKLSAVKIPSDSSAASTGSFTSPEETFNWEKAWYPVLSEPFSDPEKAHAVQLLGRDLVVWRDNKGQWAAFDDRCPHRAAPLTEGRVEKDGSLLCSYHAWRFDANGKCLSIPQSDREGKDENNARACAKAYPTQVAQEIIWVWPDNGPDAVLESLLSKPVLIPALEDKEGIKTGRVVPGALVQRDLAYSWETFVENVLDPAHIVVAHHGVVGKRTMARPISLKASLPSITKDGFAVVNNSPQFGAKQGVTTLRPPSLMQVETELGDGRVVKLVFQSSPTKPGWTRVLFRQMTIAPKEEDEGSSDLADSARGTTDKKKRTLAKSLLNLAGRISPFKISLAMNEQRAWIQHLGNHLFLQGDLALLHHQEKILASTGHTGSKWKEGVFTPTISDIGVQALRAWITKFGGGGPTWVKGCDPALPPREFNRDVMFDVYQVHTKHCTACLGALKRVEQCTLATRVAAVLSLVWAVVRASSAVSMSIVASSAAPFAPLAAPSPPPASLVALKAMLPAVLVTLASLSASQVLEKLRRLFYFHDAVHQDLD